MNENLLPRHLLLRRKPGESEWETVSVTTDPGVAKDLIGSCIMRRMVGEYIYATMGDFTEFAIA
jgi:hypothetical protein